MFGRMLRKKLPIYRERTSERIETKPSKFKVGMKVRIQNPHTKLWDKTATLTSQRPSGSWKLPRTEWNDWSPQRSLLETVQGPGSIRRRSCFRIPKGSRNRTSKESSQFTR